MSVKDASYFERLPSYRTVYKYFKYTRPLKTDEYWRFIDDNRVFQFWNQEYTKCLADGIRDRAGPDFVLEVGAGDGMLSYYLRQYGVNIRATDSGEYCVKVRAEVEITDAISAIRKHRPRMAVASWLPRGIPLDIQIFNAKVPIIVLIGEEHGAAGSERFWNEKYWKKVGYEKEYSKCDRWNICLTDFVVDYRLRQHSSTAFYILKTKQKHGLFRDRALG